MVTSQQEVQTITKTSTGYNVGHNVNPYEELTMEPITAMILAVEPGGILPTWLVIFTDTKSLFVFGSITSLLPWPGGYHHHIGVRPAGPGRDHHHWLGGELLSRLLPHGHQIELATCKHDSIQDYISQAGNIAQLHNQISSCDGILARMENLLLTFQTDRAGCISDNYKTRTSGTIMILHRYFLRISVHCLEGAARGHTLIHHAWYWCNITIVPSILGSYLLISPAAKNRNCSGIYTLHKQKIDNVVFILSIQLFHNNLLLILQSGYPRNMSTR